MENLQVGDNVEICRSDGRTHSSVISEIHLRERMVDVEWFEANETKGKTIDYAALLRLNPKLVPAEQRIQFKQRSAYPVRTENKVKFAEDPTIIQIKPAPIKEINTVRRNSIVPAPNKRQVKPVTEPLSERRTMFANERRLRENFIENNQGNPNWEIYKMILDYKSGLVFQPLRPSDTVINDQICVCIRKRPLSSKEKAANEIEIVTIPTKDQIHLHQPKSRVDCTKYLDNQKFRFDYTFDDSVDNEMVYHFTAKPLIDTIFQGGFATCFAYGQTGSGKTHTMGGDFEGKTQNCSKGIYAMCAVDVFKYLNSQKYADLELYVVCSFFELYGSKPLDLLSKRTERKIFEDKHKNIRIVGLKEVEVSNAADVLKLIREGSMLRTAGQTSANLNSSRSHAVFQIILKKESNSAVHGKFSLIDLAGSERGADTQASQSQVRQEGGEINKSLLALKECIRGMGMNKAHIPFRQSKLTMVLRDSFIGRNAKTCMIATISPGLSSSENTANTLRYANRVKELDSDAIQNLDFINEEDEDIVVSD